MQATKHLNPPVNNGQAVTQEPWITEGMSTNLERAKGIDKMQMGLGRTMKANSLIQIVTATLVFLVALGSFALSYNALQDLATRNGITGLLSYVWPLLIDASLIVFSLAVVNAHLQSESTWKQWTLVGIYTVATIGFNVAHAPGRLQAQIVAAIAPVSLFFSFELLMGQLRNTIKRNAITRSRAELTEQVASIQTELDTLHVEAEQRRQIAQTELNRLNQQLNQAKEELSQVHSQLREAKRQATSQKPADVSSETRDEAFKILVQWEAEGVRLNRKGAALARELSTTLGRKVSRKTGSTLLKEYQKMGTTIPENGNGTQRQGTWERFVDTLPMDETGKDALNRSVVSFTNGSKGDSQ